jgi:ribose transport system ATP-binding protein
VEALGSRQHELGVISVPVAQTDVTPPHRAEPRLELVGVSKSFAGTRALEGVSLGVLPGEVHVVAGENGAGKSTLIRVIAGAIGDFSGELRLDGRSVRFTSPAAAVAAGIATIHQELSLVPALSVADNFELVHAAPAFAPFVRRAARERALAALGRLELALDPDILVERLSVAERQLVEIARALAGPVRVLVMDEPTSALAEPDAVRLMTLVERLRREGIGIVYISHRLDEIFRLADRITVLRDGRHVFTRPAREVTRDELVGAMVGRTLAPAREVRTAASSGMRLRVRQLTSDAPRPLGPLAFELRTGETLGIAGVEGSGASTILQALFGAAPGVRAELELDGVPYAPESPRAAFARGVALLASDRHDSVLAELSVLHNATLSSLGAWSPAGLLRDAAERRATEPQAARTKLKAPSLDAAAGVLSGGNQQKTALVRCLLARPRLLLLDDPTRGIDVAARADVHELLRDLASTGTSILFRSTDLGELALLSDRVLVLARGRPVAMLERSELGEEKLLALMMGGSA